MKHIEQFKREAFTLAEVGFSVGCSDSETRNFAGSVEGGKISERNLKPAQECNSRIIRYKWAFTLAEVLITLGIIGIVAALTIPNLMSNYQAKKLQTQLQRANAIIQQAGLRMKADEINLDEVVNKRDYQTFQSYFKDGGCELPKQAANNVYRTYSNTNAANASASRLIQPFCLADGQILWIGELYNLAGTAWTKDTNNAMLAIDINGWKNKPNRYGHDVFFWAYDPKAQMLVPMGESKVYFSVSPSIYYKQCPGHESWGEQGIGCTYKALNDKSYFSNLPK